MPFQNLSQVRMGHYLDGNCKACPGGRFDDQGGRTSPEECPLCQIGLFSLPAASLCEECPDGYIDHTPRDQCHKCPTGFVSRDRTHCMECPSEVQGNRCCLQGHCSDNAKSPDGICPFGYEAHLDICWECEKGHFERGDTCWACPRGYISQDGEIRCHSCPQGSNGTHCLECPLGQYVPPFQDVGLSKDWGNGECRDCPLGYQPIEGGCQVCPPGTFGEGCQSCPQDNSIYTYTPRWGVGHPDREDCMRLAALLGVPFRGEGTACLFDGQVYMGEGEGLNFTFEVQVQPRVYRESAVPLSTYWERQNYSGRTPFQGQPRRRNSITPEIGLIRTEGVYRSLTGRIRVDADTIFYPGGEVSVDRKEAREILRGLPREAATHTPETCEQYCEGETGCTAYHEGESCRIYGLSTPHGEPGEGECNVLVEQTFAMVEGMEQEVLVEDYPMQSPYWLQETGEVYVDTGEALRPDGNVVRLDDLIPWELRPDPCVLRAERLKQVFYLGDGIRPTLEECKMYAQEQEREFEFLDAPQGAGCIRTLDTPTRGYIEPGIVFWNYGEGEPTLTHPIVSLHLFCGDTPVQDMHICHTLHLEGPLVREGNWSCGATRLPPFFFPRVGMFGGEGGELLARVQFLRPPDWVPGTGVDGKCGSEWGCSGHGVCSDLGYFCHCEEGYAWREEGGVFTCRAQRRRLREPCRGEGKGCRPCPPGEGFDGKCTPCPPDTFGRGGKCIPCPEGAFTHGYQYEDFDPWDPRTYLWDIDPHHPANRTRVGGAWKRSQCFCPGKIIGARNSKEFEKCEHCQCQISHKTSKVSPETDGRSPSQGKSARLSGKETTSRSTSTEPTPSI